MFEDYYSSHFSIDKLIEATKLIKKFKKSIILSDRKNLEKIKEEICEFHSRDIYYINWIKIYNIDWLSALWIINFIKSLFNEYDEIILLIKKDMIVLNKEALKIFE